MLSFQTKLSIRIVFFQGMEFAEAFLLEYQRQDGGEWIRFRNKSGVEVSTKILSRVFLCSVLFGYVVLYL